MQELSMQAIDSIITNLTRCTPRSDAYKAGVRAALALRYNTEANTVSPWRPGTVEFDAYCHGRDTGETIYRHELQLERAA